MTADIEKLCRELVPQVLGLLARRYRDFAAAEDAVQEALLAAALQWPVEGVPANPKAWFMQVASRRLTDEIRRNVARRQREHAVASEAGEAIPRAEAVDDTLTLIYMCCHPALTVSSAIALTLRAVGGLTTAEIAAAFLVPEATMAQRIGRAKQAIRSSGIAFEMPSPAERPERLKAVLHVLYLIFNEGYSPSSGDRPQRMDLAAEAIRLTRLAHASLSGNPEAAGLLALMLLTDARREARCGPDGEMIPLDRQNRALWNRGQIEEGIGLLTAAFSHSAVGAYQLQAAISAVHAEAASTEETDWKQILALYEMLSETADNPMVKLNRAVAVAMVHGPREGLARIVELVADSRIRDHHRLYAVRAHLLEMAGEMRPAADEYEAAAKRSPNLPERDYLLMQAGRVRAALL